MLFVWLFVTSAKSQIAIVPLEVIDVENYSLDLKVNDSTNRIEMTELITFKWLDTTKNVRFDLADLNEAGKGMVISSILDEKELVKFDHKGQIIELKNLKANKRNEIEIEIKFSGIPIDGLVIGKNKYGDRTFFGDNWPDRAHNWFACVDHPLDKATIEYRVTVPKHYSVIANGILADVQDVSLTETLYNYRSHVPLPTKVLVVGIADFEIKEVGVQNNVPISSWVYPQNSEEALKDLEIAPSILNFYIQYIGKYEYEKLANVQSTTRYGGMENAGCIFYDENALNGKGTSESLIAHEIAHQWFGNSASESNWEHIWLSEGFATYFTNLYLEKTYGTDVFQKQLKTDRSRVINFYSKYPHSVVDTTYSDLLELLNPNSYQKGSWVLHMLRRKIGDENFQKGIRIYYQKYRLSNAVTEDFRAAMEEASGIDLKEFFREWLYTAGHPMIKVDFVCSNRKTIVTVKQIQNEAIFNFPLTIQLNEKKGKSENHTIEINQKTQEFEFKTNKKIKSIDLDPNVDLLFEEVK